MTGDDRHATGAGPRGNGTSEATGASSGDGTAVGDEAAADRDASTFAGEDLVVGYPSVDEPVVEGASLSVPPGEVTALVGPNGSGKSTLLKGLATQLSLTDGVVSLDGADVHDLGTKELARRLGLLSQENAAPDSITVADLVGHGRYPHQGFLETLSERDQAAIDRAIGLAGIDHLRDREMSTLSGGQRQLVWIAMVVAQETDVLLLDEPTTFLDLQHQMQVMEIVERLRDERSITVVLVLHDIDQAARYADHMIALDDGAVYDRGSPETVVTEDLLADVFGIEATVTTTERGPQVTPLRSLDGREARAATGDTSASDDTGGRPDESSDPESTTPDDSPA